MLKERRFISWSVLLFAIVLILILMEHAQREVLKWLTLLALTVLILILMEHAQRAVTSKVINAKLEQS